MVGLEGLRCCDPPSLRVEDTSYRPPLNAGVLLDRVLDVLRAVESFRCPTRLPV